VVGSVTGCPNRRLEHPNQLLERPNQRPGAWSVVASVTGCPNQRLGGSSVVGSVTGCPNQRLGGSSVAAAVGGCPNQRRSPEEGPRLDAEAFPQPRDLVRQLRLARPCALDHGGRGASRERVIGQPLAGRHQPTFGLRQLALETSALERG